MTKFDRPIPVTTLGDRDPIPFLSSVSDSVIISCRVEKNDNSDIVPKLKINFLSIIPKFGKYKYINIQDLNKVLQL